MFHTNWLPCVRGVSGTSRTRLRRGWLCQAWGRKRAWRPKLVRPRAAQHGTARGRLAAPPRAAAIPGAAATCPLAKQLPAALAPCPRARAEGRGRRDVDEGRWNATGRPDLGGKQSGPRSPPPSPLPLLAPLSAANQPSAWLSAPPRRPPWPPGPAGATRGRLPGPHRTVLGVCMGYNDQATQWGAETATPASTPRRKTAVVCKASKLGQAAAAAAVATSLVAGVSAREPAGVDPARAGCRARQRSLRDQAGRVGPRRPFAGRSRANAAGTLSIAISRQHGASKGPRARSGDADVPRCSAAIGRCCTRAR